MYLCNKEHFAFILLVQYIPVILGNWPWSCGFSTRFYIISLSVTFFLPWQGEMLFLCLKNKWFKPHVGKHHLPKDKIKRIRRSAWCFYLKLQSVMLNVGLCLVFANCIVSLSPEVRCQVRDGCEGKRKRVWQCVCHLFSSHDVTSCRRCLVMRKFYSNDGGGFALVL